jgi:transposase-like protein
VAERVVRKKRLSPEEKLRIVEEAASKEVTDTEVCRRWGIDPWDLRRFREQVRKGALAALAKTQGRPAQDRRVKELTADLARTERALKELAIDNTLLRGKVNGV